MHELLASPEVRDLVVERLGEEVAPGGEVDRSLVADRVFGDEDARDWLETTLWPRVGERMLGWKAEVDASDPPPPAAVVEVPLLFESGMDGAFDATLAVVADEAVRRERAGGRGHAALEERTSRQLTQEEKAARATYTVANSGTIEELEQTLTGVLEKLNRR